MGATRDTARRSFNAKQYLIDGDPGVTVYRDSASAASNLVMKVWTDIQVTNSSGALTFALPAGFFTVVRHADATVWRDTANPSLATFAMCRAASTTAVAIQCFESKLSGVLVGGVIEGLELATAAVTVSIKVVGY